LDTYAVFYDYIVYNSSRYYASQAVGSNCAALVEVLLGADQTHPRPRMKCGEILDLFEFNHGTKLAPIPIFFAQLRWFRSWDGA
jgi:hypothetical protein